MKLYRQGDVLLIPTNTTSGDRGTETQLRTKIGLNPEPARTTMPPTARAKLDEWRRRTP